MPRLPHPMWLAAAAVGLLALLSVGRALGHGDAAWIMNGGYLSANGTLCCGVGDCHQIEADAVRYSPGSFHVKHRGNELTFEEQNVKVSKDDHWWACIPAGLSIRCLFRPPVGS